MKEQLTVSSNTPYTHSEGAIEMAAAKWLQNIGHVMKVIFTNKSTLFALAGIADELLPGFSPLINSAAASIINSEAAAAQAGMQNGTGTQKMAYAISVFQPTYNQWAAQNNLSQGSVHAQNVLQSVFNLLDELQCAQAASAASAAIPLAENTQPVAQPSIQLGQAVPTAAVAAPAVIHAAVEAAVAATLAPAPPSSEPPVNTISAPLPEAAPVPVS